MKLNKDLIKKDIKYIGPVIVGLVIMFWAMDRLFHTVCPLRFITGVPCPGCGITRAFLKVLHLDLVGATRMHPFWIPVLLLAVCYIAVRYLVADEARRDNINRVLFRIGIVVAALGIVYYIYRMVTVFPGPAPMEDDHMWLRIIPRK